MKKMFIATLVSSLLIANSGVSYATEKEVKINEDSEPTVTEKVYEDKNVKYVESHLENEQINMESTLKFDELNDELSVEAILKDNGTELKKEFSITILELTDENNFKAVFTDKETNEEYVYDTAELQASALPVVGLIVGVIAKQGLKTAIKNWSKSVVASMIRSVPAVAKEAAKDLGYSQVNETSHGQKVFKRNKGKGPKYISPDKDGHNGGAWKGASSIKNLGSKKTRSGTYDAELNRIGD
ncbi:MULTISPECIES: SAR2788 family putative toxin [unclassified Exiguobacterium]|uniref:SAR2788 family putative toxin n=1 Tax=unclassified Exiguobacterium TaxID=2644629 RepID=UPI001BE8EF78|nr:MULTISPECIES: SAR2788 family putative toxin [unclassified Exiguobacterium]